MRVCALTTLDNPFDPIDDFDNWYLYDIEKNYGTCSYLARMAKTSEILSNQDFEDEIERAIDDIVEQERIIGGIPQYKKVVKVIEESDVFGFDETKQS